MERETINLTNTNSPTEVVDKELDEYIQRQVQILDRVESRFTIKDAPENIHYEWHPDDPETHQRLTSKGFKLDDDLARKSNYAHTDGSGAPRIADVRCYSIPMKFYKVLQKLEAEKSARNNDPRRAVQDFESTIRNSNVAGLEHDPKESYSRSRLIPNNELVSILNTEK